MDKGGANLVAGTVVMGGAEITIGKIHDAGWTDNRTILLCSNNEITIISISIPTTNVILKSICSSNGMGMVEEIKIVLLVGAEDTAVRSACHFGIRLT